MHAGEVRHTQLSSTDTAQGCSSSTALGTLPEAVLVSWGQGRGHSGSHHLLLLHGQAAAPSWASTLIPYGRHALLTSAIPELE